MGNLTDLKFKSSDFGGKDVTSLPDNPSAEGYTAADLKARFDNIAENEIALGKFNSLVDELKGTDGAANIGISLPTETGLQTVQAALDSLGSGKVDRADIAQAGGRSATKVMSQRAVTDAIEAGGGGGTNGGGEFEPVGCMKFFGGEELPSGYLWCDGTSYPINGDYAALYAVLGARYNQQGDAIGTFRVPDLRGRVAVGKDTGTFDVVGKTGGEQTHTLTKNEMPVHNHSLGSEYASNETGNDWVGAKGTSAKRTLASQSNGGGAAHNNLQPYLVCNYIIKYSKSYEEIGVTAPPCIWEFAAVDWQQQATGGYKLLLSESDHHRGAYCVLTALYETAEGGVLKAVLPEMEKDASGNITIWSDTAFAGTAYIDRVYMVSAGRVVSVNGQTPDVDGDVAVAETENAKRLGGNLPAYYAAQADLNTKAPLVSPVFTGVTTTNGGIKIPDAQTIGWATGWRIYAQDANAFYAASPNGHGRYLFYGISSGAWSFLPNYPVTLGNSNYKWGQIYSTNSVISTSDRKEKTDVAGLPPEKAKAFLAELRPCTYRLKDGTSGRTHYGLIAQEVEDAMTALGLGSLDFAGFIKSPKMERVAAGTDENGNPVIEERAIEGEYVYGLRYEEFIAPVIAALQAVIAENNDLKNRLAGLEARMQALEKVLSIGETEEKTNGN